MLMINILMNQNLFDMLSIKSGSDVNGELYSNDMIKIMIK